MKKLVKKAVLMSLIMAVVISLYGCGFKNKVNEDVQSMNPIMNGEYSVLDVRETVGGNNIRVYYIITIILQDSNNNRFYYEYEADDTKGQTYINLGKLIPEDHVLYENGEFKLIEEGK